MENIKLIKFLIPIFILGFFVFNISSAFAYEVEAHAYLTSELIGFYNKYFPNNQISDELLPYIIDGSRREDDPPRWFNHFYDPVYNRGLTIDKNIFSRKEIALISVFGNSWPSSKQWLKDDIAQSSFKYNSLIGTMLSSYEQGKIQPYINASVYTWQKAISYWLEDNKEMAMFALGHALHLLEDLTVPDHTRNDPHPGDSPYEIYTERFNLNSSDKDLRHRLENKTPIIFDDFNLYFDELAKYSNNNFYSKDTIEVQSGYDLPVPDGITKDGKYYYAFKSDDDDRHYLFVYRNYNNSLLSEAGKNDAVIRLENEDLVIADSWRLLSTKSVQYGAGLINLFFQEVENAKTVLKEKQDQEVALKWYQKFGNAVAGAASYALNGAAEIGGNAWNAVFFPDKPKLVGTISSQEADRVELDASQAELGVSRDGLGTSQAELGATQGQIAPNTKINANGIDSNKQNSQINTSAENKLFEPSLNSDGRDGSSKTQNVINTSTNINQQQEEEDEQIPSANSGQVASVGSLLRQDYGGQAGQAKEEIKQCLFETASNSTRMPIIFNEIAWMGNYSTEGGQKSSDEWIELKNLTSQEIDLTGYQIIDKKQDIKIIIGVGSKNIIIAPQSFFLLERTDDNTVPFLKADLIYKGAINNTDEHLRLFDKNCNLIDEVVASPNWLAGDSTNGKSMERSQDLTWHTYTGSGINNIFGTPKQQNSEPMAVFVGSAYSGPSANNTGAAQAGSGSQQNNNDNPPPQSNGESQGLNHIVISEILPNPIGSDAGKEFVELYNPTAQDISLSGWALKSQKDGTSTSTSLARFESRQEDRTTIKSKGYLLIGLNNYNQQPNADVNRSASLLNDGAIIFLYNNEDVLIDRVEYRNIPEGKSYERRAFVNSQCVDSVNDNEFNGNGCDRDGQDDFIIRDSPMPQNLDSREPRSLSITNFGAQLNTSPASAGLNFLWSYQYQPEANLTPFFSIYKIENGNQILLSTTTSLSSFLGLNYSDTGREYEFLLTAVDREGMAVSTSTRINVSRVVPLAIQEFRSEFSTSTLSLNFSWSYEMLASTTLSTSASTTPQSFLYQLEPQIGMDQSISTREVLITDLATSTFIYRLQQFGRTYEFLLKATTTDGFEASATTTINVPGYFDRFYFYEDSRNASQPLIEFYNSQFWPLWSAEAHSSTTTHDQLWTLMLFFLNDQPRDLPQFLLTDQTWSFATTNVPVLYNNCSGASRANQVAVIPYTRQGCSNGGGIANSAIGLREMKYAAIDKLFLKPQFSRQLTQEDFLSVAIYDFVGGGGGRQEFRLRPSDATRYYLQSNALAHVAPQIRGDLAAIIDNRALSYALSWQRAIDPDTVEEDLIYQISYSTTTEFLNWADIGPSVTSFSGELSLDNDFYIAMRARDDFGNASNALSVLIPRARIMWLIDQQASDSWSNRFGRTDGSLSQPRYHSAQSISDIDGQFNYVILNFKRVGNYPAYVNLSIYPDNNNKPDLFVAPLASQVKYFGAADFVEQDIKFLFNTSVAISSSTRYWLFVAIDYRDSSAYFQNYFVQKISRQVDFYQNGESGIIEERLNCGASGCPYFSRYDIPSPTAASDWWMRMGLLE